MPSRRSRAVNLELYSLTPKFVFDSEVFSVEVFSIEVFWRFRRVLWRLVASYGHWRTYLDLVPPMRFGTFGSSKFSSAWPVGSDSCISIPCEIFGEYSPPCFLLSSFSSPSFSRYHVIAVFTGLYSGKRKTCSRSATLNLRLSIMYGVFFTQLYVGSPLL